MIEGILSGINEGEPIHCLPMSDAQVLIDQLDHVRSTPVYRYGWDLRRGILLTSHCGVHPIFRPGRRRYVLSCCIGRVATMHSFQTPSRSQLATTNPAACCTGVGMRTCGRGNIAARMSP